MSQIIHIRTAIIGAGVAGTSAAATLLSNKHDQFLVFEGLERVGGRVCTQTSEKGYLEIGAQVGLIKLKHKHLHLQSILFYCVLNDLGCPKSVLN